MSVKLTQKYINYTFNEFFSEGRNVVYTELFKIIEGGLKNDPQKVRNYSIKLATYLENNGEINASKKISNIVESTNTRTAELDSFTSKPFDSETHVDTVDLSVPVQTNEELFFTPFVENEVKEFLQTYSQRDFLMQHGIESNNRLLLFGEPGTGKTSLARYISLQTNLPLVTARLDGIVSSLLGSTAKNIRKVFQYSSKQPCILFLDEFDVLAKVRDDKHELGELKRVVNSLIQNIDAFDSNSILIAATNHPNMLDNAVWRRFDSKIELGLPDPEVRRQLIMHLSKIMPIDFEKDTKKIKKLIEVTNQLTPDAINTIFNKAAKSCLLKGEKELTYAQIILEVYIYRTTSKVDDASIIKFMINNLVSQKDIAKHLSISMRKVRTIYMKVKEND